MQGFQKLCRDVVVFMMSKKHKDLSILRVFLSWAWLWKLDGERVQEHTPTFLAVVSVLPAWQKFSQTPQKAS